MALHQRQSQRIALRTHQRGMSFVSVVLLVVFLVALFAVVAQSVPVFVEYVAVQRTVNRVAGTETSPNGARIAFDRAAGIENITSIKATDLKIIQTGSSVSITYEYERQIPLVGPAYLVYRFDGASRPTRSY